jgi:hypothetical protein
VCIYNGRKMGRCVFLSFCISRREEMKEVKEGGREVKESFLRRSET